MGRRAPAVASFFLLETVGHQIGRNLLVCWTAVRFGTAAPAV